MPLVESEEEIAHDRMGQTKPPPGSEWAFSHVHGKRENMSSRVTGDDSYINPESENAG